LGVGSCKVGYLSLIKCEIAVLTRNLVIYRSICKKYYYSLWYNICTHTYYLVTVTVVNLPSSCIVYRFTQIYVMHWLDLSKQFYFKLFYRFQSAAHSTLARSSSQGQFLSSLFSCGSFCMSGSRMVLGVSWCLYLSQKGIHWTHFQLLIKASAQGFLHG